MLIVKKNLNRFIFLFVLILLSGLFILFLAQLIKYNVNNYDAKWNYQLNEFIKNNLLLLHKDETRLVRDGFGNEERQTLQQAINEIKEANDGIVPPTQWLYLFGMFDRPMSLEIEQLQKASYNFTYIEIVKKVSIIGTSLSAITLFYCVILIIYKHNKFFKIQSNEKIEFGLFSFLILLTLGILIFSLYYSPHLNNIELNKEWKENDDKFNFKYWSFKRTWNILKMNALEMLKKYYNQKFNDGMFMNKIGYEFENLQFGYDNFIDFVITQSITYIFIFLIFNSFILYIVNNKSYKLFKKVRN
ncbi:hypothetical protein BCF59_0499 [Mycoplasmopsis mustelae]|uniref:Uncharacterized protein n=1 Tax=Mycoplasmopsis mustelae TaxID=171289 RepID=A0A4R7UDK4_9BACT|nr:hypothetical protein [Mycoplasmopsis mustelae]TDV23510.1 hypothetical protein BCF59_0499 [Mycoplasmopsis mustelae]